MKGALENRTNAEWLEELRRANPAGEAVEQLRTYVQKALARLLRSRANVGDSDLDDFTQDALIRILQSLDGFRGDSRFTTWATAVAIRVALSALRRRRYSHQTLEGLELGVATPVAGAYSKAPDPARASERKPLIETLHQAIQDTLTERQRTVVLAELAGVPSGTLVERLETNPNALYKLNHDARKKLKRALNDAGYSDEDVRQELERASEGA